MSNDIALWSATRQAEAIRRREISSRGLLEHTHHADRTDQPELNAVVNDRLHAAARRRDLADSALARGDVVGPLHGVPITIKDALETKGIRSTGGAIELHNNVPTRDAPVVRAVKAAGAIVIGKTNLPRWSGDVQTFNEMFGTTVNPWNAERVPGGSSGGAVRRFGRTHSFEIGTDIGGSIRIPAAFNGIFGTNRAGASCRAPAISIISPAGQRRPTSTCSGPLARSADDLETAARNPACARIGR
jgi:amidase